MTDFGGAIRDSQEYDIGIIGIPFDEKSCYLRGAAKGPDAIRSASTGKAINPWTELGVNLELVDVKQLSFIQRLKMKLNGGSTPYVQVGNIRMNGFPTKEEIIAFYQHQ